MTLEEALAELDRVRQERDDARKAFANHLIQCSQAHEAIRKAVE